jgi:hypothetical protein
VETQVRTPQAVFMQPQRLVVPLFQRPYVWNQEEQWEPLWNDLVRLAEVAAERPAVHPPTHFLGAVVLQQVPGPIGLMQERTIIDGQQRLTTLQLLLDALHSQLLAARQEAPALRIEQLVSNPAPFRQSAEDRFKVWPTNRDRSAFNAVMGVEPPIDYENLGFKGARMLEAHRFFAQQAQQWLAPESEGVERRALAIEQAVRERLQIVVIDLAQDENAQAIFETLNARGTPLTAADLIKNFVFQRLAEGGSGVQEAYERYWRDFETAFWETEVQVGRMRYPRSSVFLNHWLVARSAQEVVAREVFSRFKSFAEFDAGKPMSALLPEIHSAASVYRDFSRKAEVLAGEIDALGLFGYRTGVLESDVVKPLLLWLLDPTTPAIPEFQLKKALGAVESWMVRRMLVRATTKGYNRFFPDVLQQLLSTDRTLAGDSLIEILSRQTSDSVYWPDDEEVRREVKELQAYRRLQRGRLRMVLEAIEDEKRGWVGSESSLRTDRVTRGKYVIEHVMPRRWQVHWPLGDQPESVRESLIHTIGNLTLLTMPLNSKVSNGPWLGEHGKLAGLEKHDALFLNRELVKANQSAWTEAAIRSRTEVLLDSILRIWPVPPGHRVRTDGAKPRPLPRLQLIDLINAGVIAPGSLLTPRQSKYVERTATVLSDGRIDVDGKVFETPSGAAAEIRGRGTNGWWFFFADPAARKSLHKVLREYVDRMSIEIEESGDED